MDGERITLSTVTPVYAGAKHLEALVQAIDVVRRRLEDEKQPLELVEAVFVDDESVDDSCTVLEKLAATYPWVRVVTLSRNFGQHPATVAGILHTSGDWVATLDEDLQHHPRHLVPLLLRAAKAHIDLMYAKPTSGVHESMMRDWTSRTFKQMVANVSGNQHVLKFNSYRVIRGDVARAAASVVAQETYFDVALSWFTNRVQSTMLEMKDLRFIETGKSGYGLKSLLSHARRMLTSSRMQVLRIGASVGVGTMGIAAMIAVGYIVAKLLGVESLEVPGWTSLFVAICFFGGLSSLLLSLVLEYLSLASLQSQGRPTYFIVDRSKDDALVGMYELAEDEACSY